VANIEVRDEDDPEIMKYTYAKDIELVTIDQDDTIEMLKDHLNHFMDIPLDWLKKLQPPLISASKKSVDIREDFLYWAEREYNH